MAGRLLVASNRGPVSHEIDEHDALVAKRGAGGLVTALTPAVNDTGGEWVAAAMTEGDRRVAVEAPGGRVELSLDGETYRLRLLAFSPQRYDHFYNTISNRLLWFLHHYLWDLPRSPGLDASTPAAWRAYREVNRAFARALAEDAGRSAAVLVQDYHLSLVPAELRALNPGARIGYFHHIPFAGPDYLRLLPHPMPAQLLSGLLGADVVGFQTQRWTESFLASCALLPEAEVGDRAIRYRGREVRVGVYPIGIDAPSLRQGAARPEARRARRDLERWRGDRRLVLRVDRAELSKNILRGFLAFGDLLRRHPEWRRRVLFRALLHPSRRSIAEYRAYTEECLAVAERINAEFREPGWKPIEVQVQDDFDQVLAAYSLYDVLVVNTLYDGMNLVAKEGPLLNRADGVVILSRNAGAFGEMGEHSVPVDPIDVAGTAEAMHRALSMDPDERSARARALRRLAAARTPARWAEEQLRDLEPGPRGQTREG
jgi:trehalose 6-phosphate synthase